MNYKLAEEAEEKAKELSQKNGLPKELNLYQAYIILIKRGEEELRVE